MLFLLLLPFLTSAEFLTSVLDHDDTALPDLCQDDTVISCNLVQIDLAFLHNSTLVFSGTTLDFLDQPGDNTFTFSTEDGDEASFTVDEELGAVWGHAQLANGRDFIIEPDLENCDGCHVVIEENQDAFPEDQSVTPRTFAGTRSNVAWTRQGSTLLEKGMSDKTTVVTYSIKVYYTPEVKKSTPDIMAMVEQVIATTNQGYINSKIPLRVVLHCVEETEEPEDHFTSVNGLEPFRKYKGGGNSLRGSADTAALLVTHLKGVCGIGYRLSYDAGNNYDESTLSMSRVDCAMAGYTFGHELSHNFGNWHDKYQRGWREDAYAQGYHIPGSKFRTIMAYRRSQKPKNTLQINYYSNPDVKIKKKRTGKNGKADAARRITEARFVIAAIGDESEECHSTVSRY